MKKILLFLSVGFLLSLVGCKPSIKPQLGFIYNTDGTFSPAVDTVRRPQGVVFAMGVGADSSWCYVISLQEFILPLTDVRSVLPGVYKPDSLCGYDNTRVWIDSLEGRSPLIRQLKMMGEEWFVPSVGEWCLLHKSYDHLYAMLDTIPHAHQIGQNNYWTSTPEPDAEYPQYGIAYDLYGDRYGSYNKADSCLVRFMMRVKLEK